ncbi:MAG TPA: DUF2934 domain-containing protein [Burkholderiales bacterium]|nr:DUF2934 domain-containing protein [Burkholderiales bacterium]
MLNLESQTSNPDIAALANVEPANVEPNLSVVPANQAGSTTEFQVSADERRQMIAEAAYFRAERRGFTPGHELTDWLEAEIEITALMPSRG